MEPVSEPSPTVGRIVHFYTAGSLTPVPAIIACVHSADELDLCVFDPRLGAHVKRRVLKDSGTRTCGWAWMPYQVGQAQKNTDDIAPLAARVAALEALLAGNAKQADTAKHAIPHLDATGAPFLVK